MRFGQVGVDAAGDLADDPSTSMTGPQRRPDQPRCAIAQPWCLGTSPCWNFVTRAYGVDHTLCLPFSHAVRRGVENVVDVVEIPEVRARRPPGALCVADDVASLDNAGFRDRVRAAGSVASYPGAGAEEPGREDRQAGVA